MCHGISCQPKCMFIEYVQLKTGKHGKPGKVYGIGICYLNKIPVVK